MNNTIIYKILGNLKHDGIEFKAGSFTSAELPANLIDEGVIKVIEGATTEDEAAEIDAEEIREALENAPAEEVAPPNTWEAKKDEEEQLDKDIDDLVKDEDKDKAPEGGEVYDGPMEYFKVVGEIHPLNEDGTEKEETLAIGSIHYLPVSAVDLETNQWAIATDEEVAADKETNQK